jgi:hypothetical protein
MTRGGSQPEGPGHHTGIMMHETDPPGALSGPAGTTAGASEQEPQAAIPSRCNLKGDSDSESDETADAIMMSRSLPVTVASDDSDLVTVPEARVSAASHRARSTTSATGSASGRCQS